MIVVEFVAPGDALPHGSKSSVPIRGGGGFRIVESGNRRAKASWRADVAEYAHRAMAGRPLLDGPLMLRATFYRRRPKGHFGSGRNATLVKASAPLHPAVMPDLLKLARGLEDALTGVVYRDDAQVVVEVLAKRYGDPPRTEVVVESIPRPAEQPELGPPA